VAPPPEPGVRTLTIETSQMVMAMAAGHRLAFSRELTVADGPPVATRLVWRTETEHPALGRLVDPRWR
jgi:hypothetical protein